ncbi:MAG: sugar ABC transporter permease [Epulopiscium sp.]|nr:sugar ABC transporter permease [Candidatus Epulonipiscium sp.]
MKFKKRTLAQKDAMAGYLFILPFIIGFLAFMVLPLIESFKMSFSNVTFPTGGFEMKFIGLKNYIKVFTVDPEYNRLLSEEIIKMVLDVPITIIFSFFIALILNQRFKGRGLVRAIFFLPVILSSGVMVGLEYNNTLLQGMKEVIEKSSNINSITSTLEEILLSGSSMGTGFMKYIFDAVNHVYDIAIASGIQIIIFLSGLQTISNSLFEVAKIEGATAWETFWKVTVPMISSLILVNVIYTIIDFFIRSDNKVMEKISDTMIAKLDYGFSSAMAWIYFIVVMIIIAIVSAIISKRVYYYE